MKNKPFEYVIYETYKNQKLLNKRVKYLESKFGYKGVKTGRKGFVYAITPNYSLSLYYSDVDIKDDVERYIFKFNKITGLFRPWNDDKKNIFTEDELKDLDID